MWDPETEGLSSNPVNNPFSKKPRPPKTLADKVLDYLTSFIWCTLAVACIYYTNFFYNLFFNPKIYETFFNISMTCYVILFVLMVYISFVMPKFYGVENPDDYNPRLIPVTTVFGVVAVISLIICIWPVWGFPSLLIFFLLWKGFFEVSTFLPGGDIGGLLFLLVNFLTIMSFKVIDHHGYLH